MCYQYELNMISRENVWLGSLWRSTHTRFRSSTRFPVQFRGELLGRIGAWNCIC